MRTGPRADLEAQVRTFALAGHASAAINLNQPGSYVTWNVFTISVANLVLIAVMVVIFGAALLLPFPGRHRSGDLAQEAPPQEGPQEPIGGQTIPGDERSWPGRARRPALTPLPPHNLLPAPHPPSLASSAYLVRLTSLAPL